MPWIFNAGSDFVSPGGRESRFDNPRTVEAFQFLADLQHGHKVAPRRHSSASLKARCYLVGLDAHTPNASIFRGK